MYVFRIHSTSHAPLDPALLLRSINVDANASE